MNESAWVALVLAVLLLGSVIVVGISADSMGYERGLCEGQGNVQVEVEGKTLCLDPAIAKEVGA